MTNFCRKKFQRQRELQFVSIQDVSSNKFFDFLYLNSQAQRYRPSRKKMFVT